MELDIELSSKLPTHANMGAVNLAQHGVMRRHVAGFDKRNISRTHSLRYGHCVVINPWYFIAVLK